eukprot:GAHX01003534.1.p1 GENE.GAHX01003534.1~~GAHX01003534.1.p1  ORF type:complete len:56 (+),score=2.33 GAHX01003534.1:553-720(+)
MKFLNHMQKYIFFTPMAIVSIQIQFNNIAICISLNIKDTDGTKSARCFKSSKNKW